MEKISDSEIRILRNKAIDEQNKHKKVMETINWHYLGQCKLSEEFQLEVLIRDREDELRALLNSFAHFDKTLEQRCELSPLFQQKLYEQKGENSEFVNYMLTNCKLCTELEKILIDSNSPHIFEKKSEIGELYLLSSILIPSIKEEKKSSFEIISGYYNQHRFCPTAETMFVNITTTVVNGRDSIIDLVEKLLKEYINRYKSLSETAENTLIKNNEHGLIMYYLKNSSEALSYQSSEDLLCKRGNREEVELYFKRYSMR